jgi:2-C-methyl-D-erythritol 4-phosphate cytidylyltransferase
MVAAIVPAGGVGKRLGAKGHKSFVKLAGEPMLAWTLRVLDATREISQIILVVHPDDLSAAKRLVMAKRFRKVSRIVPGGDTRMQSVACGLAALDAETEWVLVHDAARPLITVDLVRAVVRGGIRFGSAISAVPVIPTIKEVDKGAVVATLDRTRLWDVQTPQVFRRDLLEEAHIAGRAEGIEATDDSMLVERLGRRRVRIVMGSHRNLKVTTPEDLAIAEALIKH